MTAWNDAGIEGGLLGLPYPALTTVYNEILDTPANLVPYNPFLFRAINQGASSTPGESMFSVSLSPGTFADEGGGDEKPNKGVLALGGVAPVSVTNATASAPVLLFSGFIPNAKTDVCYGVTVDSCEIPSSTALSTQIFDILNTGTSLSFIPTPAVMEKFVPDFAVMIGDGVEYAIETLSVQSPPKVAIPNDRPYIVNWVS
ncbi:hypothetical protein PUNSTDRAFT_133175 [Punctularia strigosozonata HHB-11173 SS5]|uniref:uncharacterized protein n=1 Tax=Punctularia strigosozonata (strain HHB-11173) TaxID=741275 RepID=UPI000441817E|nr:uncharacterized protein PUNSTDRAFT_133175 [Punctularia strigosozonata HHB-11173 SS5]EIN11127.1 hypothetical protein PUNSTDRAFT_133175 [Punctularia strigosozonata HHB-11173 SS5]